MVPRYLLNEGVRLSASVSRWQLLAGDLLQMMLKLWARRQPQECIYDRKAQTCILSSVRGMVGFLFGNGELRYFHRVDRRLASGLCIQGVPYVETV